MELGFKSDLGRKRKVNEDSIILLCLDSLPGLDSFKAGVFVLADGMGGHNAGEVASRLSSSECARVLLGEVFQGTVFSSAIRHGFERANSIVRDYVKMHPDCAGMGSTLSLVLLAGGRAYIGHVGDSRVYKINREGIKQITRDHSLVQELIDRGELSREEARNHPQKNVVTRAVGSQREVAVDLFEETVLGGDFILLCCDGLSNMVEDQLIRETVLGSSNPQEACDRLVSLANKRGGHDNISVIIIRAGTSGGFCRQP